MDPDSSSVAMLYQDPHPAHEGFARAIGADLVDYRGREPAFLGDSLAADVFNGLALPDYDVYLVEGSRPLYTAVCKRLTSDSKIIYLCADHGLYELGAGDFKGDSAFKSIIGRFGTPIIRTVGSHAIDGVIAVSEFAADFTRPIVGSETPISIAHPYIQPDVYAALGEVNPDLSSNTAVTVGRAARYKGTDLLVEAWSEVRESFPDAKLHVVGGGHPTLYGEKEGVVLKGYVEELAEAFGAASLFVQPSRMDTFPVSTLEGMRAGLPPLVTTGAGTRSVAREIDDQLVVEPSSEALADGVSRYFKHAESTKQWLAARSRRSGNRFDESTRKAAFQQAFREVIHAI